MTTHGGYVIGTRREAALTIAAHNEELARAASWTRHIPDDPQELIEALDYAGVDLDELWRTLEQKRGSRR